MINFFLRYAKKWWKRYKIQLLPLGHPKTDDAIDKIDEQEKTILLLDELDDDANAIIDYRERLTKIIAKTIDFQTIIISSRTQFFPSHVHEPAKTGILKHGGEKGEYEFKKLYVAPFDYDDVKRFTRKKYRFYQRRQRRKAKAIVDRCPHLMVRPMLLAYIESLMEEEKNYEYAHEIYEAMVRRWIKRERVKNKEDLRRFSEAIAVDMYRKQKERKGLFVEADEIEKFADRHGIRMKEFELKGQSLLNRDVDGRFKFAHKSILEYFLALQMLDNIELAREFKFDPMEFTRSFLLELSWCRHWLSAIASKRVKGRFRTSPPKEEELTYQLSLEKLRNASQLYLRGVTSEMILMVAPGLSQVTSLDLNSNQIANVDCLQNFTNLKELHLHSNQVANIGPLQNLTSLQQLDLHSNQITDIGPLQNLTNLRQLDLQSNQITDISPLQNLTMARSTFEPGRGRQPVAKSYGFAVA